jgi:hypothetical protein
MICLGGSKSPGHGPSWVPDWLEMWSKERPKTSLERVILQDGSPVLKLDSTSSEVHCSFKPQDSSMSEAVVLVSFSPSRLF